ncbi:MAG TPA: hypothetical protein PKA03_14660 [Tabrizicola sp.]|nr:hypothetical protein [Tabrizicola sp.]
MSRTTLETSKPAPRPVTPRFWQGIAASSAIALAATPVLAQGPVPVTAPASQGGWLWLADAEGGEGGEVGAVEGANPDVAYLARLAIVEGHLVAAMDLYRKGMVDEAIGLSYHPEAEMMEEVRASLATHGVADVTPEMAAFSAALESGGPVADVEVALATAQTAFAAAAAPQADELRVRADALILLTRAAAHEYEESTEGGSVGDVFAYHEAHAFIEVARSLATALSADAAAKPAADKALAALDGAAEAFGDMSGTTLEAKDPAILQAVAAKVELALSSVH